MSRFFWCFTFSRYFFPHFVSYGCLRFCLQFYIKSGLNQSKIWVLTLNSETNPPNETWLFCLQINLILMWIWYFIFLNWNVCAAVCESSRNRPKSIWRSTKKIDRNQINNSLSKHKILFFPRIAVQNKRARAESGRQSDTILHRWHNRQQSFYCVRIEDGYRCGNK